jgi:hypothetical protein
MEERETILASLNRVVSNPEAVKLRESLRQSRRIQEEFRPLRIALTFAADFLLWRPEKLRTEMKFSRLRPTNILALAALFLAAKLVAAPPETESPASVKLSGILALPGKKRALLLVREPGSGSGTTAQSRILGEGQKEGAIEVIEIDEKASTVRIRNGGKLVELTFETDGVPRAATPTLPDQKTGHAQVPSSVPPPPYTLPVPNGGTPDIIVVPPAGDPPISSGSGVHVFGRNSRRAATSNDVRQVVGMGGPQVPYWAPRPPASSTPPNLGTPTSTPLAAQLPPSWSAVPEERHVQTYMPPPIQPGLQPPTPPPAPPAGSSSSGGSGAVMIRSMPEAPNYQYVAPNVPNYRIRAP